MMTEGTTMKEEALAKRAEFLFVYDTRMSNPNGDPDENKPRYDQEAKRVMVTEFRAKRTERNYMANVMNHKILLRQEVDKKLEQEEADEGFKRPVGLAREYLYEIKGGKNKRDRLIKVKQKELLEDHLDVKLHGILFALPKDEDELKDENGKEPKATQSFKQIGPVQISMGQSLNTLDEDTDIMRIGMTSLVPNTKKEGVSRGGSFGEKWIVRYALIQHKGFVNNNVARDVGLTEKEVGIMLQALWNGTDELATTSKFGQKSRLLIKVNYKDNGILGDFDILTKLERNDAENKPLENITQLILNVDNLLDLLKDNKNLIESVEYQFNSVLKCKYKKQMGTFGDIITKWSGDTNIPVKRL